MSYSASKSSKSKKGKQKGKGKTDSTDRESWRLEAVPKLERSAVDEKQAAENSADQSKETEPSSSIHSTEPKQIPDTTTNEEENIVKPQNVVTENEVAVTETKERDEDDSRTERKAEVTSEKDVNLVDTCGASENIKSDVVFKQEQVVPLRSRGELKIIQRVHVYVFRFKGTNICKSSQNIVVMCQYKRLLLIKDLWAGVNTP